jgi:hypothetical protein
VLAHERGQLQVIGYCELLVDMSEVGLDDSVGHEQVARDAGLVSPSATASALPEVQT